MHVVKWAGHSVAQDIITDAARRILLLGSQDGSRQHLGEP